MPVEQGVLNMLDDTNKGEKWPVSTCERCNRTARHENYCIQCGLEFHRHRGYVEKGGELVCPNCDSPWYDDINFCYKCGFHYADWSCFTWADEEWYRVRDLLEYPPLSK